MKSKRNKTKITVNPKALYCVVIEGMTFREFWNQVCLSLWKEGEGFSGKRPSVDSGWQGEIIDSLVENGFIKADITQKPDEENCIEYELLENADDYIEELIKILFKEKE